MKKIIGSGFSLMLFSILLTGCKSTNAIAREPNQSSVDYQTFYDDLSPYGTWIDYAPYGNVWHPDISGDFRPYFTNGFWRYTTMGNMWMSGYNWGWAPFHYGRWVYDDFYGWLWVPGYEWSPGWVTWGMFDGFYGWAPILPWVNVGVGFGSWRPSSFYWNVVKQRDLYDHNIMNVAERREDVDGYVNRINIIKNFGTTRMHNQYYSKGPDRAQYEKSTGLKVEPAQIREISRPGENREVGNDVQVYRPTILHPQPQKSRRINTENIRPEMDNLNHTPVPHEQQMQNVRNLPEHVAPRESYDRGSRSRSSGGGRGGRY